MNNVAALALLMPLDLQAAKKSHRSASLSLMPLSFASILGGMITLIGTPPNIIIAEFRGEALGESYKMFDFAPVGLAREAEIRADDVLVIETSPDSLEEALGMLKLEYVGRGEGLLEGDDLLLNEVLVQESSRLAGRSAMSLKLLYRYRVALVGVSRQGRCFRDNVRKLELRPGDVLLLLGPEERLADVTGRLGLLPLADRGQRVIQRDKIWLAVSLFVAAIAAASTGLVYLPLALGCVAAAYVFFNIVPIRDVYNSVECVTPCCCHDDAVRRHEQHGDGCDRGADCGRNRAQA